MERTSLSKLTFGSSIPKFSLPSVDGKTVNNDYFKDARAALVVFTCNHCPYVKGSEEMLLEIVKKFSSDGLKTVAICSNNAAVYPEDSFEKMKEKAATLKLPYPYLYDESQQVARAFDAECTPECFLFDAQGNLTYHGTITDRPKDAGTARVDLLSPAITSVLEGQKPNPNFNHPIGCSIKWR